MKPTRAFSFIYYQQKEYPKFDCLNFKENGRWHNYSTQDVFDIANKVSLGLLKLGIKSGDKMNMCKY